MAPKPTPVPQGTYGICFKDDNEESTTPVTANEVLTTYTAANTLVESVSEAKNVYASEYGLKVDNQGSIKFNLKNVAKTKNIESVYFVSQQGKKVTEVDVKLNDEDISFESSNGTHALNIAGYFDEGISSITISTAEAFELIEFGIYVKQVEPPVSSSSAPVSTSEISSESEAPTSSSEPGDNKKSGGCNGSIIAVVSLTGMSALIGSVLLLSKKRKK